MACCLGPQLARANPRTPKLAPQLQLEDPPALPARMVHKPWPMPSYQRLQLAGNVLLGLGTPALTVGLVFLVGGIQDIQEDRQPSEPGSFDFDFVDGPRWVAIGGTLTAVGAALWIPGWTLLGIGISRELRSRKELSLRPSPVFLAGGAGLGLTLRL